MAKRDYYEVLGVKKSDDDKTIKKAYKRLAMKHHPDRNADNKEVAEKKFKEIQEAYGVISDPQKRQTYDQFGHDAVNNSASGGNPFGGGGNPFGGGGVLKMYLATSLVVADNQTIAVMICNTT
jgi:molecular chaperone DnaJ